MIRIAFTLIGGRNWTGGYNYLLNLVSVLSMHKRDQLVPVLFFGADADADVVSKFAQIQAVEIVSTRLLDQKRRWRTLATALFLGSDPGIKALFREHSIDIVFEAAQYFGAGIGIPSIAWIPDLQHKFLPDMFTISDYLKRELGYRAQIAGGRLIMLSSEDSRRACEQFYPSARGRTQTVHFAIPANTSPDPGEAREIADEYGLPTDYVFLPNQFWKHKNHLLVAQALILLRDRGQNTVIAASGHPFDTRHPGYFGKVLEAIRYAKLHNSYRILGMLPREHIAPLMSASLALLNPSLFEGWSTTVEEARSLGVPLLLSNLEVHREQAGDEATYFERHSASSLADALQVLPRHSPVETELRRRAAQAKATKLVQQYADDFMLTVLRAMNNRY